MNNWLYQFFIKGYERPFAILFEHHGTREKAQEHIVNIMMHHVCPYIYNKYGLKIKQIGLLFKQQNANK